MPKPRTPGLWMVDGDDQKKVLAARKHLLTLLDDPYYFEAYQSLLREKHGEEGREKKQPRLRGIRGETKKKAKHPKLLGIKGRMPDEIGALAHRLQNDLIEPDIERRKGPGRPRAPLTANIEQIRIGLEKLPGSLKSNCRAFIKASLGADSKYATDWLYSKVRSNRRNAA